MQPFEAVPRALIDAVKNANAIAVYVCGRRLSDWNTGHIPHSLATIGELAGLSEKMTRAAFVLLRSHGWAALDGPPGSLRWRLIPPSADLVPSRAPPRVAPREPPSPQAPPLVPPREPPGISEVTPLVSSGEPPVEILAHPKAAATPKSTSILNGILPGLPEQKKEQKKDKGTEALFAVWKAATGKTRAKLDPHRAKWLAKGLAEWGDRAESAIRGLALSPFHMGKNDRNKAYNEPEHAFRTAGHAEGFIELWERSKSPEALPTLTFDVWEPHYLAAVAKVDATRDAAGAKDCTVDGVPCPWSGDPVLDLLAANVTATIIASQKTRGLYAPSAMAQRFIDDAKGDYRQEKNKGKA